MVSVVGVGTNELRLVPKATAIDMLLRSFELGVNFVHTSPDYEGAEDLVAEAVSRSGRRVIVASQGYDVHGNRHGRVAHFERLFDETCRRLKTDRLDLYGIAAVDDREAFGENVWGPGGMVEFLRRMKREGRLGSAYCTNHGDARHMRKLVESGVFDALMLSCNPLGYHLLTLHPPPGRHFEDAVANRTEIVPLCRERDIGVIAMMPLAGGLLVDSRAFPPRRMAPEGRTGVAASDVLRAVLEDGDVACAVPGTASIDEAEENASAGLGPIRLGPSARAALDERVATLRASVCSRCGACEPLCSRALPVSWMFRAAEMAQQPAEAFETWAEVEYFALHPEATATCARCDDVTCACPAGIDIPAGLIAAHEHVTRLAEAGLAGAPRGHVARRRGDAEFGARLVVADVPEVVPRGGAAVCRLHLENVGSRGWFCDGRVDGGEVLLRVFQDGHALKDVRFRDDVHAGGRGHIVFELPAPHGVERFDLRLKLLSAHQGFADDAGFEILFREVRVDDDGRRNAARRDAWMEAGRDRLDPQGGAAGELPGAPPDYGVRWIEHNLPRTTRPGDRLHVYLRVQNVGARAWAAKDPGGRSVNVVVRVDDAIVTMPTLPHDVLPGAEVVVDFPLDLPTGADHWRVEFGFVEQDVAWFEQHGARPLRTRIARSDQPATEADHAIEVLRRHNPSPYSPTQGVARSRTGRRFPSVVAHAAGARIRDPDGGEWVDYVMGWGAALLGYAHPAVTEAIASVLGCGAVLGLPHRLEAEVTRLLLAAFPSADVVLFGKNGSDACTAAIRAARIATGRDLVLFSGYHGWQESFGPAFEERLPTHEPAALRFDLADLSGFGALVERHGPRVAAVMVEPAAQVGGVDGPVRDADAAALAAVVGEARRIGAVVIFDEIMTGFRHPGGSVQAACGLDPDLTCLGKALSSGAPVSALVGRRAVLEPALDRIFYHPTFKGDAHALAAAAAALRFYRSTDVPAHVWAYGTALMQGIDRVSRNLGVDGGMQGLPYRMVYRFGEPDPTRRTVMRTLLLQGLMQRGILTFRGFMLPSLAHGEAEAGQTISAFEGALKDVRDAAAEDRLVSRLDIPLIR